MSLESESEIGPPDFDDLRELHRRSATGRQQVAAINMLLTCPVEELALRALFIYNRGYMASDSISHTLLARGVMEQARAHTP
jgi:hypothetical protein